MKTIRTVVLLSAAVTLAACSSMEQNASASSFSQEGFPAAVQVPAGNEVAMETVGKGTIWYECKAKTDAAGQFVWVFGGPDAGLWDRSGKSVGKYYGPPATWESNDGSKLTATQVAVAAAGAGNIPHQLVKANPAVGTGAMTGVTYIQRVATKGGIAPSSTCDAGKAGAKATVNYQADYIFWKAA
ncbi:hypothetical protein CR159_21070 [Pollutimonas subterranea]|uniref:DUF3455 domain-containing protein n=1 Tax=Pollutimonas subterranea TaxID=2045210 RepID=A0A2N4TYQ4_9BURK|nr:DUF3455 domain-containing protein [Pollutimonas subterranea]PLC47900.1 hypothetical protein CR159_21070 [Pollutimonas subterranea]